MTVDEFVQTEISHQFRDVVTMIRRLMREIAPDAEEVMSYGMPVFKGKRIFAWMRPAKNDIYFAFSRGVQFEDRYGLLQGAGKTSRHVKIKSVDAVGREALEYYVRQALTLDKE